MTNKNARPALARWAGEVNHEVLAGHSYRSAANQANFNMPVWSALNAGLLEKWIPPASVETVLIFGDNDRNGRGQQAADHLERRLKALGYARIR